jgi:hypothetical protein
MTRDEAIRILKYNSNVIHKTINGETDPNEIEALDMAIKALEAQEWVPCKERLPEEDHWIGGSGKQFSDNVLISITNREDEDAWSDISQTIDGKWALELPRHCKITAWRNLPEPYREEVKHE